MADDSPQFDADSADPPLRARPPLAVGDAPFAPALPRSSDAMSTGGGAQQQTIGNSIRRPLLVWLLAALVVLVLIRYLVPQIVQDIQYALVRGRQRAEVEVAIDGLDRLQLADISIASQLVARRIAPSVVHINVMQASRGSANGDERRHLFGQPLPRDSVGQGSGVIIDDDGYIVTNYHVVQNATLIQVLLSDSRAIPARIIGSDPLTDLALIKIDASNLTAAEWGDSDSLNVGALVWAVGSPFGLDQSITQGILSAKNRPGFASPHQAFLQTDAAVNPGNSGGALVNLKGHVIGINTAIVGRSYQGISFAIPSTLARDVVDRLRANGRVSRGWLGVALDSVTPTQARQFGWESARGAAVMAVVGTDDQPSPAMQAGIRRGDIILQWDGEPVESPTKLSRLVAQTPVGKKTDVLIFRAGQELAMQVTVGERPAR